MDETAHVLPTPGTAIMNHGFFSEGRGVFRTHISTQDSLGAGYAAIVERERSQKCTKMKTGFLAGGLKRQVMWPHRFSTWCCGYPEQRAVCTACFKGRKGD